MKLLKKHLLQKNNQLSSQLQLQHLLKKLKLKRKL